MPAIILHIVFKDQYHLYDEDKPFGLKRRDTNKFKYGSNGDLLYLNDDLNLNNTYHANSKNLNISTSPSGTNLYNMDQEGIDGRGLINNNRNSPESIIKGAQFENLTKTFENQNFVFIKVKDKHQYDLNPKVIKFFLAEMLKEERNRIKLCNIHK